MEVPQRNSQCNYFKQAKMSFIFSFAKSENRRGGQVLPVGDDNSGRGKGWVKVVRGLIWCKYCAHMNVNGKKIPVETISRMAGRRDEGE
jgi:hypothetical protein